MINDYDLFEGNPIFYTATVVKWRQLFQKSHRKRMVTDSLHFLVDRKRIAVYAFVIMPNHIHLIWQVRLGYKAADIQRDFMKFTCCELLLVVINTNQ